MNFVRNKTRLKGDIYTVIRSLTLHEKISKWTSTNPIEIVRSHDQRVDWRVSYGSNNLTDCQFHVMRCTSETEFCTEVHLMTMVSNAEEAEAIDAFSKALLEELRISYNKAWVIKDSELNASIFKESF